MKTILITGANRGIGLEFVVQLLEQDHTVLACCRNPEKASALQELAKKYKKLSLHTLDVRDDADIQRLKEKLKDISLDWLINNAGISGDQGVVPGNIQRENFLNVMNVNCVSPLKLSDALLPQLKRSKDKLIICISSEMGSIKNNQRGYSYAYRTSKAALNCAMHSFAINVADQHIAVMLLHPGWVKTDLGGMNATLDVKTSVSGMLQVIEINKHLSHAEVLRSWDGNLIDW